MLPSVSSSLSFIDTVLQQFLISAQITVPQSTKRKSLLATVTVGLVALTCVNAAALKFEPNLPNLSDEEKCKLPWGKGDISQDRETWTKSGAGLFLGRFLDANGTLNWSRDLLTQTVAKGTQGGTQYSCTDIDSTTCGPPDDCLTYKPVEAWLVHTQMSNLFSALHELQERHIKNAISAISSDIHKIVQTFGVVKDDGSDAVFKALLAVIGSLTGIVGTIGATGNEAAPFVGPVLGIFSAVVGYGTGNSPKTAEAIQGEITYTYGQMFTLAMGQINGTVKKIFGETADQPPITKRLYDPEHHPTASGAVYHYFKDAMWLDPQAYGSVIDLYSNNTNTKMLELCLIQAMKDNEYPYMLRAETREDPGGQSDDFCTRKYSHLYKDRCLYIVQRVGEGGMFGPSLRELKDLEMDMVNSYTQDFNAALENNWDCLQAGSNEEGATKAGDRETPLSFNPYKMPSNYFRCFWNLDKAPPLITDRPPYAI